MHTLKAHPKARDIMTADPICAKPATGIRELARIFEENEISGVPVVDHLGRIIGVVSKTDLIRRCTEGTDDIAPSYLFEALSDQGEGEDQESGEGGPVPEPLVCVEDFMTEDPLTVSPEVSVNTVARLMFEHRIHRIIVVDGGRYPIGIITSLDLLGVFPTDA